jgi:hypothetical protein
MMSRQWFKFYLFFIFIKALDDYEMRPEDTCLYEKMMAGITKLQDFGLKDLRTEDKINIARYL